MDIKVSDKTAVSLDLKIRDDSPLAKAGLKELAAAVGELCKEFSKPVDQADIQSIALGGTFSSPDLLSSDLPSLKISSGINGCLRIVTSADKLLFPADGFSPQIPVSPNQAWIGAEFDLSTKVNVAVAGNGLGVSFEGDTTLTCSTFSLFSAKMPPLPSLGEACATALSNYSIVASAAGIRLQLPGTVNVIETNGSVTLGVSFSQPFTINPLASASLPFNITASVQPQVTLKLAPSVTISGDLLIRCYKVSDDVVRFGVYKKHGTTLSVTLTGAAGIGGDIGSTDVLGMLLNAALPGVDAAKAGIVGDNAKTLNQVIKNSLNRSLAAQINATCSAAATDEAAVLYEIHLNDGDRSATDQALGLALHGDWTALESLTNANRLRNIAVETAEKKRSISINLLGFFNATSAADYLKSCTVLVDKTGQLSFVNKVDAKRISVSAEPFAADGNKLRQALIEDFLCTVTYKLLNRRLALDLTSVQLYFDYDRQMSRYEMEQNVRLGYALGVIAQGALDATLKANASFHHAYVGATVRYDMPALLDVFYRDTPSQTVRTRDELVHFGRDTMSLLLDPNDDTDSVRLGVLGNDPAWAQMDELGNVAAFNTIPLLGHLGPTQLAAVSADWISIAWWANAISKIAPALSAALSASQSASADPEHDRNFIKARDHLANVLAAVTRDTDAAFVHGWGEAVMFALSGRHGSVSMDITWNSQNLHFGAA